MESGHAGISDGGAVEVWVYWVTEGGGFMKYDGSPVCDPCTLDLSSEDPAARLSLHQKMDPDPLGPTFMKKGFLIVAPMGEGADAVGLEAQTINNQSGNTLEQMVTPLTPNYLGGPTP